MMAEALDSYDKVDHPKVQFGDWEALSIHEADSRDSEDDSSQSGLERDSRPRSFHKDRDCTSAPDGQRDLHSPPPGYQPSNGTRKPSITADEASKADRDEPDSLKSQAPTSIHRYSLSSNPVSATSSLVESPTSISFPQSPISPTSTVVEDNSKPTVRFTDRGPPRAFARRPATSRRSSANAVPTITEWGVLFDEKGYATFRNGQFLRGLAKYIIDDFAPNSSNLVITPEKLSVLYSKYRLDSEVCPFLEVFNSRARDINDRIADFFSDLDCQYHLIQLDPYSRPRVPALTPVGFAQFLTTCILAHPDEEFRRLDKIVSDVQIFVADPATADGPPEKLPRQLMRSQFPVKHDPKSRKILAAALDDLLYDLRLLSPVNSRPPLAIMPPPPSPPVSLERRDSASGSITPSSPYLGVRHYAPVEKRYVRRDGYAVPATSSENTSGVRPRYLPPEPLRGSRDDVDRERAQPRYEDEPESYHHHQQSSPTKERQPADLYPPPARFSTRALLPGPSSASTAPVRSPSYLRSYSSNGPPPSPSSNSATAAYTPVGAGSRRAQSPPLRTYRASAPDVSSTSASASTYYKPAGYVPAPPTPTSERRDHPLANSVSSAAVVDPGSRRSSAAEPEPERGGPPPPPPPPHQQIVLARSSTMPIPGAGSGSSSSSGGNSKAATATTSSSPSSPTTSSSQPTRPDYGSRRTLSSSSSSTALMNNSNNNNMSEKKQHQHQQHSSHHHHHHHRRRRSAVVAVEQDRDRERDRDKERERERDRGPTWEEVLKAQGGGSSLSSSSSQHHHRHHHRAESSSGKSGGGGGGSRGYHHRDRSAH